MAGQDQIAQAREPGQRLEASAELGSEADKLRETARGERGVGAGAILPAFDDARCDSQHVLDRAADLHRADVVGPIDAEVPVGQRVHQGFAQRAILACERHRHGQVARHLGREARPRQHSEPRLGQFLAYASLISAPVSSSKPLVQMTTGVPAPGAVPARARRRG